MREEFDDPRRPGVKVSAQDIWLHVLIGDQTQISVRTSEDDGSSASLLFGRSEA